MSLQSLTPMLRTWDLPGTMEFYTRTLGFTCKAHDAEAGWALLVKDQTKLMLSGPNHHEGDTQPKFTGSLYFQTDAVDELWSQLKDQVRVCYPVESFDYGMREFGIYDNNGYLLQFGQEILSD